MGTTQLQMGGMLAPSPAMVPMALEETYKKQVIYTLWLFNIAMENCPFIDGLPIKNGDFPWLC